MAVHIRNMKELQKAMQPVLLKMTHKLAERVYETLNYFLQDYYACLLYTSDAADD